MTKKKLRVFISYSRKNRKVAKRIEKLLKKHADVKPVWDAQFSYGHGFPEQIRSFISHAHVFMPIITPQSNRRGWVHQEIGFAMAMNIPVLPVVYTPKRKKKKGQGGNEKAGKKKNKKQNLSKPGEFLQLLQAIHLSDPIEKKAQKKFSRDLFEGLCSGFDNPSDGLYQCSELREERAMMMAKYAKKAERTQRALNQKNRKKRNGLLRQRGGLSSFNIPQQAITDRIWRQRYKFGKQGKKKLKDKSPIEGYTRYHSKVQRQERIALERHARASGCSLIINPKKVTRSTIYSKKAYRKRLER